MGENLEAPGRLAVRTPMQWSAERNGGFSSARPGRLPGPVTTDGFGPEFVNVSAQRRDPDSLLRFMSLLVRRYRECPELGWTTVHVLDQPHPSVLALCSTVDQGTVITVHNLSSDPVRVPLVLEPSDEERRLVDLLQDGECEVDPSGAVELPLEGYGHRWLRLVGPQTRMLV